MNFTLNFTLLFVSLSNLTSKKSLSLHHLFDEGGSLSHEPFSWFLTLGELGLLYYFDASRLLGIRRFLVGTHKKTHLHFWLYITWRIRVGSFLFIRNRDSDNQNMNEISRIWEFTPGKISSSLPSSAIVVLRVHNNCDISEK